MTIKKLLFLISSRFYELMFYLTMNLIALLIAIENKRDDENCY